MECISQGRSLPGLAILFKPEVRAMRRFSHFRISCRGIGTFSCGASRHRVILQPALIFELRNHQINHILPGTRYHNMADIEAIDVNLIKPFGVLPHPAYRVERVKI
jgi:hypothetical protein